MMETKTKIREVFVNISSLLLVSRLSLDNDKVISAQ